MIRDREFQGALEPLTQRPCFVVIDQAAADKWQPLVTRFQHGRQVRHVKPGVVVNVRQDFPRGFCSRPRLREPVQGCECSGLVYCGQVGVRHDSYAGGAFRRAQRLRARHGAVERVECLDAHPPRAADQVPATLFRASQRSRRQLVGQLPVRLRRLLTRTRPTQRIEHAKLHLACRFARERDGENLLRIVDHSEQPEIALDEQLGLARARRRLDDERARYVKRVAARLLIRDQQRIVMFHGAAPYSGSTG